MPDSLQTPPPLKPQLDPSAKSWIQIAVGQRGPKGSRTQSKAGGPGQNGNTPRAEGSNRQEAKQATPGSPGSGVAQVLSVDEERLVDERANRPPKAANGNGEDVNVGPSNGSSPKQKQSSGVSLFGSYKAPIKRE